MLTLSITSANGPAFNQILKVDGRTMDREETIIENWSDPDYRAKEGKTFYDIYCGSFNDLRYRWVWELLDPLAQAAWENVAEAAYSRYYG